MGRIDTARMVSSIRPSLVALAVSFPSGTVWSTGVVAESGGIIATTASALAGAASIATIDADGQRQPAQLVGIDRASGIAVLRIGSDLPVAGFNAGDLSPGSTAVAVSLVPGRYKAAAPLPAVYAGTVRSSGTAVGADAVTTTFAATVVGTPLGQGDRGCPLLSADGAVSGILETTKLANGDAVSIFLPAELVLGVTRQLVAAGTVDRGWMGIEASDVTPSTPIATTTVSTQAPPITTASGQPTGVLIDAVTAGSAAAGAGLRSGDTIVAIGGEPVHSMAELRTRLYAEGAGTVLQVTVKRSTGTMIATIELTGEVSAVSSSPLAS